MNPEFSKPKVKKFIITNYIILISLLFIQCGSEKNFETNRYSLNIVALKVPEQKDFVLLASGFTNGEIVSLPDRDSKLIFADCSDSTKQLSIFVEHPCTSTQVSAGTCDSATICKQVGYMLSNIPLNDVQLNSNCNDSIQVNNIRKVIQILGVTSPRIYVLSHALNKEQILSFYDTTYEHFYSSIDSLRVAINNDVINQSNNIVVIYYPPIKKDGKGNKPIFQEQEKEKPKVVQTSSDNNSKAGTQKTFKIITENKTFFEWTNLGQGVNYDYTIVDYDSPEKRLAEENGLKEHTLDIPSNLIKGRQYTLTVTAKRGGKGIKSKDCIFSIDENGSIIQDCKK